MAGRRGRRLGSWACRILRWGGGLGRRVWDWRWGPWVEAPWRPPGAGGRCSRPGRPGPGGPGPPGPGACRSGLRAGGCTIRACSAPARPVAAVESEHGGEVLRRGRRGGAVRPSDHRGPDARVSGRAGRGLRLGAGERAMIATGLAQGDSAALIARRIGRCRQTVSREIRRGAGVGRGLPPRGGTGRGPGAVGPPQDPQAGRRPGPARAGRRPAGGSGQSQADRRPPAVREPR